MIKRSDLKKLGEKPAPMPFHPQQILSHQVTSVAETKPNELPWPIQAEYSRTNKICTGNSTGKRNHFQQPADLT